MSAFNTPAGLKSSRTSDLPQPDVEASAHSTRVLEKIRSLIRENDGRLSFEQYMNAALYFPQLGYYHCGSQKFGAGGDFITAPEISPLFAQCLARFIVDSGPGQACLEVGAGSGKLAAGILHTLAQQNCLPEHYYILELSEELRHRQQQTLTDALPDDIFKRVMWLNDIPDQFNGIVLANELLDAMPVRRFLIKNQKIYEQFVIDREGILCFENMLTDEPRLTQRVSELIEAFHIDDEGDYLSEINFIAEDWIKSLGNKLQSALLLLIDYGYPRNAYYHPQRRSGTLMCHYQHRVHPDPLLLPGIQDITTHIDFTAMADAALEADMDIIGFTTQGYFLVNNGLLSLLDESQQLTTDYVTTASEIKRLTLPGEMGEHFKVLAVGKKWDAVIPGFEAHDMRHLL